MEKKHFIRAGALVCAIAAVLTLSACSLSVNENQNAPSEQTSSDESAEATFVSRNLDFTGKDLDGKSVKSSDVFSKNKITLVNVWSVTCPYCIDEMPDLAKLHTKLKEKNAGVLSAYAMSEMYSQDEEIKEVKDILSESKADFPLIIIGNDFYNQINIAAYPLSFLVDQNGKIIGDPIYGARSMDEYQKIVEAQLK